MNASEPRPPITDSPWFWAYVFATAALAALALAAPKFAVRQAQVERSIQARQRAVQSLSGQTPDAPLSTPGHTRLTLAPLFVIVAAAAILAWSVFWWRRQRTPPAPRPEINAKDDSS